MEMQTYAFQKRFKNKEEKILKTWLVFLQALRRK